MAYTEIKQRNGNKYYYRVISVRNKNKVGKKRIYLGVDLNNEILEQREVEANNELIKAKINKNLERIKPKILRILKKYGIRKAGIFGSYVRGDNTKKSDVDILVKPKRGMGLEFVGMGLELEDKLKRKVDLVTYKSIHPLLKKQILKDEVRII